jgi:hypothetical protein
MRDIPVRGRLILEVDYEAGTANMVKEGIDENGSDIGFHDDLPDECKYCGKEVDNAGGVACNNCLDKRKDTLE